MTNHYDTWKSGGYEVEKNEKFYSEEQLLLEQIDTLETRLNERIRHCLHLQSQLKRLAQIEESLSTFGTLTFEEHKEKQVILSIYQII
jgi:hypothetical protein